MNKPRNQTGGGTATGSGNASGARANESSRTGSGSGRKARQNDQNPPSSLDHPWDNLYPERIWPD